VGKHWGAGSDVPALEEPSTRSEGKVPGWITDWERPPLNEESHGSCTAGILFSKSVVEEPITTRENRSVIGLDRDTIAGREAGEAARALYTGRFVQSRRTWRSRRRCQKASGSEMSQLERPSAVGEAEGREGRCR
jgi:hypothetical protein